MTFFLVQLNDIFFVVEKIEITSLWCKINDDGPNSNDDGPICHQLTLRSSNQAQRPQSPTIVSRIRVSMICGPKKQRGSVISTKKKWILWDVMRPPPVTRMIMLWVDM